MKVSETQKKEFEARKKALLENLKKATQVQPPNTPRSGPSLKDLESMALRPVVKAIEKNDATKLGKLLENKAFDIKAQYEGKSLLFYAISFGSEKAVETLMKHNAKLSEGELETLRDDKYTKAISILEKHFKAKEEPVVITQPQPQLQPAKEEAPTVPKQGWLEALLQILNNILHNIVPEKLSSAFHHKPSEKAEVKHQDLLKLNKDKPSDRSR